MTQPTHTEEKLKQEWLIFVHGILINSEPKEATETIMNWWLEKFRTTLTQLVEKDLEWAEKRMERCNCDKIKGEHFSTRDCPWKSSGGYNQALTDFINHKREEIK